MYEASSDARNRTALATSSGRPARPIGTCRNISARTSGSAVRFDERIGGISPGCTELTRMLSAPCCTAAAPHDRYGELHAEEDPAGVDRHQQIPGCGVEQVLDRTAAQPGVIDEDVELAELGEGRVDRRLPFRFA